MQQNQTLFYLNLRILLFLKGSEIQSKIVTSDQLPIKNINDCPFLPPPRIHCHILILIFFVLSDLWGTVNNAGVWNLFSSIDIDNVESMKNLSDVNLWGVVAVTKTFLPLLKKSKGRIVNVSSSAGRSVMQSLMSYCISKYGVEAFSDSLRLEMKIWSVSVHIIEPGLFKTEKVLNISNRDYTANIAANVLKGLDQKTIDEYGVHYLQEGKWQ